jgi:hypothetical protein
VLVDLARDQRVPFLSMIMVVGAALALAGWPVNR